MSDAADWRAGAAAEYRAKRAELLKKVEAATKAEKRAMERRADFEKQLGDLEAGARAFGLEVAPVSDHSQTDRKSSSEGGSLLAREIIMTALEDAYPKGLRAKQLKEIIEQKLGRKIHYKTPGMTLYRMESAGDVRREGYDWFAAKAPPETLTDVDLDTLFGEIEPDEDAPTEMAGNDLDWLQRQYEDEHMRGT